MKKKTSIRTDEQVLEMISDISEIYQDLFDIETNQTDIIEGLIKSGLKQHIRMLQASYDACPEKGETYERIGRKLEDLSEKHRNFVGDKKTR